MSDLSLIKSRIYSRLGQRGAIFGMAVNDAALSDDRFILLTADLATLSGMDRYVKQYPLQFLDVGIAEQNMVGIAAGLAAEGFHPVVTTYATFVTMRSCEQIRHYLGYMGEKVVVVGSGAGLCQGYAGNTHYTIEDIAMMRSIPNLYVLSPADAGSAVKLFELALTLDRSVYIRLTGNLNCPVVYKDNIDFFIGGSHKIREGRIITIFATGTMVKSAMDCAELLEKEGVSSSVVDVYSIKPIDRLSILSAVTSSLLVTIEEHNTMGGLGAAVSEVLAEHGNMPRLICCGIKDEFTKAGEYCDLLRQNRLLPDQLCQDILMELSKNDISAKF